MIEYSYRNSLRFGYDGGTFNERPTAESVLKFTMDTCMRNPGTFQEECGKVAALMVKDAIARNRIPVLMMSGGMDSEVMAKAFIDNGFPFEVITFRFLNGLNDHELYYVERFHKRHGLKPRYFDINAEPWIESHFAKTLWEKSYSSSAVMLAHMRTMSHVWRELKGMPILGGGDVVIEKHDDLTWHYSKYEYILAWYWHMRVSNIHGGVAFFQHTPEITLSMLREPEIESVALGTDQDANEMLQNCRTPKYMVYQKYWPDLERRQKFGGAEKVRKTFNAVERRWTRERLPMSYDSTWSMPYQAFRESIEPL